jgi:hypothetical protein
MSLKYISNIDRRLLYALMFVIVTVAYQYPLGLPLPVGEFTQSTFDTVNELVSGDIVVLNFDVSAIGWDEVKGSVSSAVPHIFEKPGLKILFIATIDQGPLFIEKTIMDIGVNPSGSDNIQDYEIHGKKYGVDFINLGYFPGGVTSALAADFRGNAFRDWYGNDPTAFYDSIGLDSAADVKLVFSFDANGGYSGFVSYWRIDFGTKILAAEVSSLSSGCMNNYNNGLIDGFLDSTRGAAEYQLLSGYKGLALQGMDALGLVFAFLIVVMIINNVAYWGYERNLGRSN